MKKLTILSGKGGVGKTTITASIAVTLAKEHRNVCADCDVDAANLSLTLGIDRSAYEHWESISTVQHAKIEEVLCMHCGQCEKVCHFDAIESLDGRYSVKKVGCEGCGACSIVCPARAITLTDIQNAHIGSAKSKYGFPLATAELMIGAAGSGKVVHAVKEHAEKIGKGADYMLIDAPAGIGCPVIAAISGSDRAILIAEPSLSGFSDLKRVADIVDHFRIPFSIIINKADCNIRIKEQIIHFAISRGAPIIGEIPFSLAFPRSLVEMKPIVEFDSTYIDLFTNITKKVIEDL